MEDLPLEIINKIIKNLLFGLKKTRDFYWLLELTLISKSFKFIINNSDTINNICKINKLVNRNYSLKQCVERVLLKNKLKKDYPKEIIKLFGKIDNFIDLPVLDLEMLQENSNFKLKYMYFRKQIDYIETYQVNDKITRGYDIHGKPFITFKYREKEKGKSLEVVHPFTEYNIFLGAWTTSTAGEMGKGRNIILKSQRHVLDEDCIEYMKRLIDNKPCYSVKFIGLRDGFIEDYDNEESRLVLSD